MKVDKVVKKETLNIAVGILICSMIIQIIFLIIGKYSLGILLGSIYGGSVVLLNFFLMGLTVQKVTKIEDQNEAKKRMQFSYTGRQLILFLLIGFGMYVSVTYEIFHWFPVLIALIYPRIIIGVVAVYRKKTQLEGDEEL